MKLQDIPQLAFDFSKKKAPLNILRHTIKAE
jgi:hypothetical protein